MPAAVPGPEARKHGAHSQGEPATLQSPAVTDAQACDQCQQQFLDLKHGSMERTAKVSLLPYNPLLSQMPRHAINASSSSWT